MSASRYLEPPEWYASLPTVYLSACVFVTDAVERVLMVKPNYRPHWTLPGGIAEEGEAPDACAAREAAEELGIAVTVGELLVVDWSAPQEPRPRPLLTFIFDGGTLRDPGAIRLQDDELDEYAFLPPQEAADRMRPGTVPRVAAALRARDERRTAYLLTEIPR